MDNFLIEIISENIGIQANDGSLVIVARHGDRPGQKIKHTFYTPTDNCEEVVFSVFQGNNETVALENELLGVFKLEGIRKQKAGTVNLEVDMVMSRE